MRTSWLERLRSRFASTPVRSSGGEPVLDLGCHSLHGIKTGDPSDRLLTLGTPDVIEEGDYRFLNLGIWFSVARDRVDGFGISWRDVGKLGFLPFSGSIQLNSDRPLLSSDTTLDQFGSRFGDAWWTDRDRHEIILFYEFGNIEWQVEFSRRNHLCALVVQSPPLLADPHQRNMYGVTHSWPP